MERKGTKQCLAVNNGRRCEGQPKPGRVLCEGHDQMRANGDNYGDVAIVPLEEFVTIAESIHAPDSPPAEFPKCRCGGIAVSNASGDITRTCISCGGIVKPLPAAELPGKELPQFLRESAYAQAVNLAEKLTSDDPDIYAAALEELRDLIAKPAAQQKIEELQQKIAVLNRIVKTGTFYPAYAEAKQRAELAESQLAERDRTIGCAVTLLDDYATYGNKHAWEHPQILRDKLKKLLTGGTA